LLVSEPVAEYLQEKCIVNADVIGKMAEVTLSGSMPFPEIVGNLIKEGVEYYRVDYVSLSFSFYGANGGVVVAPLTFEGLPEVSIDFNAAELRSAILDSQQNGQKFRQFCIRATKAGVQSYFAFLRGQRVLYIGRQGDQHVEWFPGAKRGDV
jgi:uncharacterized protein YbcV (DUF1398 family)